MVETKIKSSETEKTLRIALYSLLTVSLLLLSACSMSGITGKVIAGQNRCENGTVVQKVMKGHTIEMCCFSSSSDTREMEVCNSFIDGYSETTIFENSEITQRKVTYPQGKMICTDIYGKIPGSKDLSLIEDLSRCEQSD